MYVLSDPRIFDPKIPSIPICPIHNQIGSTLFLNSIKAHLKFFLYSIQIVIKPAWNFKFEICHFLNNTKLTHTNSKFQYNMIVAK